MKIVLESQSYYS